MVNKMSRQEKIKFLQNIETGIINVRELAESQLPIKFEMWSDVLPDRLSVINDKTGEILNNDEFEERKIQPNKEARIFFMRIISSGIPLANKESDVQSRRII